MNELDELRGRIDSIDRKLLKLLARRMRISRQIGILKRRLGIPVFQKKRLLEILKARSIAARELRLPPVFSRKLFKLIHDESLKIQNRL